MVRCTCCPSYTKLQIHTRMYLDKLKVLKESPPSVCVRCVCVVYVAIVLKNRITGEIETK